MLGEALLGALIVCAPPVFTNLPALVVGGWVVGGLLLFSLPFRFRTLVGQATLISTFAFWACGLFHLFGLTRLVNAGSGQDGVYYFALATAIVCGVLGVFMLIVGWVLKIYFAPGTDSTSP